MLFAKRTVGVYRLLWIIILISFYPYQQVNATSIGFKLTTNVISSFTLGLITIPIPIFIFIVFLALVLMIIFYWQYLTIVKTKRELKTSESQFSQLSENINDIICKLSVDGTIEYISSNSKKILSYEPGKITGQSFYNFIHPLDVEKVKKDFSDSQYFKKENKYELRCVKSDQSNIILDATIKAIYSEPDCLKGFLLNLQNVTEHRESESRLFFSQFALDNVLQSVIMIDPKGNVVYYNENTRRLMKRPSDDKSPLKIWELSSDVSEDQWDFYFQHLREVKHKVINSKVKTPYGEIFLERHATYAEYKGNEYIITNTVDLTHHYLAEEKIRTSEKNYRTIVENIYDVVWMLDLDLNTTFITPSIERLTGYTVEEHMSLKIEDKYTPESVQQILTWYNYYSPLINKGEIDIHKFLLRGELEYLKRDGGTLWTEITIKPLLDETDNLVGLHGTSVNIDERKRTEIALRQSQQKYKTIYENIIDVYFETNLDGILLEISPSIEKLSKFKIEELMGTPLLNHYYRPETRESFIKLLQQNGSVSNFEITLIDKDDKKVECSVTARLLFDESGKGYKICGTVRDMSDKILDKKRIQESEERYKTLVDLSPNPIMVMRNGKFYYTNPAAISIFGFTSSEEFSKTDFIQFIEIGDRKKLFDRIKNLDQCQECENLELNVIKKDGKKLNILVAIKPISYDVEPALLFVCQDITEQKKYATEILNAKRKAEESDNLKTAFLANMSHEIRTPLNGIIGFSGLLKNPGLEKHKLEKYTQVIDSSSHQLLAIINDIIDISKIESGQMIVYNEPTNLKHLLSEISIIYKSLAEKKGLEFRFNDDLQTEQTMILADELKIKQVLNNLLNNALKFTKKGFIELICEIRSEGIVFEVNDSGIGIPKDYQEIIFERFRQVEIANNKRFGGTGLGLSISKAIIEMMGGRIWLKSEQDKGTEFYFTIPYAPYKEKGQSNATLIEEDNLYLWDNKTFVIAEDESTNFFFIEEILKDTGANILYASNGLMAVDYFKNNKKIDLVLLDIKMPELNGYEALKKIRTIDPNVKIIAQTAFALSNDREKAIKAGFDDYISKPIDPDALLALINKYIS
jgi:PAS domain S-box-containing protein